PEKRLSQEGFFNPVPIRKMWEEHQSGERNWQNQLWDILMFQAWLEKENI
ncbi:MAG: asparagine synthase-related protein, partial [Candidatus Atribacteria bacterium]|nr:asparagine synthase-related protein [Candidatus Atribacteria bacterium]